MASTSAGVRSARPPGKTRCGRRANRSNRSAWPGDRLGGEPARHARHGDPVSGEALEVEHVRRDVAEIRRPVHGDVHVPPHT